MNELLVNDLNKLRNTLMLIEVRGESVKVMSNCLFFAEQMVADIQNGKYDNERKPAPEGE